MKKQVTTAFCVVMGLATLAFDNPNDKWIARRAMIEISRANRQEFNDTVDSFIAERLRMTQVSGNMGINPQAQVTHAISTLSSEQRVLIIELIWAKIKQEIYTRNFVEAQRIINLTEPALEKYDPQYKQRSIELATLLLSAIQR